MPKYKYKAKKGPNEFIEGIISSSSKKEAIEELSRNNYIPVSVEEVYKKTFNLAFKKISFKDITVFTYQLAVLLKSGVSILDSLNILVQQAQNIYFKNIIEEIYFDVKSGSTISDAFSKFPEVFSKFYIAMVKSGEDGGTLVDTLFKIVEYRRRQEELFSRFRMALVYPAFMLLVGFFTILFMFTFAMPRLLGIYSSLGKSLPLPTKILLFITYGFKKYSLWIIIVFLLIILFLKRYFYSNKILLSKFKLKIPIFGNIIFKKEMAVFSRTLSTLIKSGVPILRAIEISTPVLKNEVLIYQLKEAHRELERGGSFGLFLKKSKIFPLFISNLITVGEESGKLDDALTQIVNIYEEEVQEFIRIFSSLFEPVIILIIGLIIGFIVIALLLPIFEISFI